MAGHKQLQANRMLLRVGHIQVMVSHTPVQPHRNLGPELRIQEHIHQVARKLDHTRPLRTMGRRP